MNKDKHSKEEAPLTHLAMTFDAERQTPNRFAADQDDGRRPDPNQTAPHKPMPPEDVGKLIVLGNNLYAGFIQQSKETAEKYAAKSVSAGVETTFRVFLNKDQIGTHDSHVVHQEPYAAVLSCIDARVPPELITGQAANDMFAVRTAGNILLERGEARGSLEFILNNYARRPPAEKKASSGKGKAADEKPLSAVLVLGHTKCGAIKAAYEAVIAEAGQHVQTPEAEMLKLLQESAHPSLDAIVERLKVVVRVVMKLRPDITDPDQVQVRACVFNTMLNYLDIKRMASKVGLGTGFDVFFGSYHVENCLIQSSNLPGKKQTHFEVALQQEEQRVAIPEVIDSLKRSWAMPETELGAHAREFIGTSLVEAMMADADEFAETMPVD